jgi:UDP-N-acetylglucosamine acyltransferase
VGLERTGFAPETIKAIKEAFRLIYRSKYNTRQAIEAIQQELPVSAEITQILEFIQSSERGIIR